MGVPVGATASFSRDFLITTQFLGGNANKKVVAVGDGVLAKSPMELIPGPSLIRVRAGNATFFSGLVATPIQNLTNFSRSLKRFQVGRAALGTKSVEFCAASKSGSDVRARLQLSATLTTLTLNKKTDDLELQAKDAFECFSNNDSAVQFTLPKATRANVGLEFFFAVNPAITDGKVTITRKRERDGIQIRHSQTVENGIVLDHEVELVKKITGTQTVAHANRTSIVLACRAPGLWVCENVADLSAAGTSTS